MLHHVAGDRCGDGADAHEDEHEHVKFFNKLESTINWCKTNENNQF